VTQFRTSIDDLSVPYLAVLPALERRFATIGTKAAMSLLKHNQSTASIHFRHFSMHASPVVFASFQHPASGCFPYSIIIPHSRKIVALILAQASAKKTVEKVSNSLLPRHAHKTKK
jgi:hypothetical protein